MSKDVKETLLDAVLASPYVKEERKNRNVQEEIDFYGSRLRLVEFLRDQIEEFFQQDLVEIVKVEVVWKHLQAAIKDDIDWILSDEEEFVKEQDWKLEPKISECLNDLAVSLIRVLHKRFKDHWRTQTLEDAKKYLENDKGVFVVLLDKDGKVLNEPYPVHHVMEPNITIVVEEDNLKKGRKYIVARYEKPIDLQGQKLIASHICEMPEDFNKAEVLKFP